MLTYTPDNPDGFKVEAGNVGTQYLRWRYGKETPPMPGSRVAVAGKAAGKPATLVVADADGGRRVTLADPAGDVRAPAWSPDGLALAYVSGGKIYRVALDDNKITKLTDGPDDDAPAGRRTARASLLPMAQTSRYSISPPAAWIRSLRESRHRHRLVVPRRPASSPSHAARVSGRWIRDGFGLKACPHGHGRHRHGSARLDAG